MQSFPGLLKKKSLYIGQTKECQELSYLKKPLLMNKLFQSALTKNYSNVVLAAFKDGKGVEGFDSEAFISRVNEKSIYDEIKALDHSLRITNVQLLDSSLKNLCFDFYQKFKEVVTINLYITPGDGKNCFLHHVDPQETFVYQVLGKKKWFVPKKDNKEIESYLKPLKDVEAQDIGDPYIFDLKEGETLYLPYCVPHKAQAYPDCLSIHISFAFLRHFKSSFFVFMEKEIKKAIAHEQSSYELLNQDNLDLWLEKSKELFTKESLINLKKKMHKQIEIENLKILKTGRPYGKSGLFID